MADARRRDAWDRAAVIVTKIHNMHVGDPNHTIRVEDVHPYYRPQTNAKIIRLPKRLQMRVLRGLFVGRH